MIETKAVGTYVSFELSRRRLCRNLDGQEICGSTGQGLVVMKEISIILLGTLVDDLVRITAPVLKDPQLN